MSNMGSMGLGVRRGGVVTGGEPKKTAQRLLSSEVESPLLLSELHQVTQTVLPFDEKDSSAKEIVQNIEVGDGETWREVLDHLTHKEVEGTETTSCEGGLTITKEEDPPDVEHAVNETLDVESVDMCIGAALPEEDAKTLSAQQKDGSESVSPHWGEKQLSLELRHLQDQDAEAAIMEGHEEHCASCVEQVQDVNPSPVEHHEGSFCSKCQNATSESTEPNSMGEGGKCIQMLSNLSLTTMMHCHEENCNDNQLMLAQSNPPDKVRCDYKIVPQPARWWSCCGIFDWLLSRS
ncbi:hypothetical protein L7F22_066249 [Adiantum nelumboides]|nr:hypothetical protein [Adiantum nelumboides]